MPWEFHCQFCNSRLRVPENTGGRRVRCPACSAEQMIPDLGTPQFAPPAEPVFPATSGPQFAPPMGQQSEYTLPQSESPLASPYQAPRAVGKQPQTVTAVAERVRAPAICLIVLSSVCLAILGLAMMIFVLAAAVGEADDVSSVLNLLMGLVQLGVSLVMLVGAINMLKLRNRGLAMAGAILGMIPVISPCCILGLPFGIWSVTVMNDPEVQRAFR